MILIKYGSCKESDHVQKKQTSLFEEKYVSDWAMGEIFPSDIKRFLNALSQVLTILGIKSVKYNEKN